MQSKKTKASQLELPYTGSLQNEDMLFFEGICRQQGFSLIAGVDEAGRGCLAGPVVAAAVILPVDFFAKGLTDSKLLDHEKRVEFNTVIRKSALAVAVAESSAAEIDSINILQASLSAMAKAVDMLSIRPEMILIDGNQTIRHEIVQKAIVKGDSRSLTIAAASVVAKVYRDRIMKEYSEKWPGYGFEKHKGYATKQHREAISELGPCELHRRSFKGVKEYCL